MLHSILLSTFLLESWLHMQFGFLVIVTMETTNIVIVSIFMCLLWPHEHCRSLKSYKTGMETLHIEDSLLLNRSLPIIFSAMAHMASNPERG